MSWASRRNAIKATPFETRLGLGAGTTLGAAGIAANMFGESNLFLYGGLEALSAGVIFALGRNGTCPFGHRMFQAFSVFMMLFALQNSIPTQSGPLTWGDVDAHKWEFGGAISSLVAVNFVSYYLGRRRYLHAYGSGAMGSHS